MCTPLKYNDTCEYGLANSLIVHNILNITDSGSYFHILSMKDHVYMLVQSGSVSWFESNVDKIAVRMAYFRYRTSLRIA